MDGGSQRQTRFTVVTLTGTPLPSLPLPVPPLYDRSPPLFPSLELDVLLFSDLQLYPEGFDSYTAPLIP